MKPGTSEIPQGLSLERVQRFLRAHLAWVLLGPLVIFYGTTVHELTHCAAAWLSGGTITDLHLLPTYLDRFVFGYMNADGGDELWTKVAPALLSACVATFAFAWLGELKPGNGAKLCFVLFYLTPLYDAAMAVWAPVFGVRNDLWGLEDHFAALFIAALAYFGAQLWAWPRLIYPRFGPTLRPHRAAGADARVHREPCAALHLCLVKTKGYVTMTMPPPGGPGNSHVRTRSATHVSSSGSCIVESTT